MILVTCLYSPCMRKWLDGNVGTLLLGGVVVL